MPFITKQEPFTGGQWNQTGHRQELDCQWQVVNKRGKLKNDLK